MQNMLNFVAKSVLSKVSNETQANQDSNHRSKKIESPKKSSEINFTKKSYEFLAIDITNC